MASVRLLDARRFLATHTREVVCRKAAHAVITDGEVDVEIPRLMSFLVHRRTEGAAWERDAGGVTPTARLFSSHAL